jgi:hypothetical protein
VRRSEFDAWMTAHRRSRAARSDETNRAVDAILTSLTGHLRRGQDAR